MTTTLNITGDAAADQLLSTDAFALLVGMLLDQQVAMETAFAGPAKIRERVGSIKPETIAAVDPDHFVDVFKQPPAVHRYPGSMAGRVQALANAVRDDWDSDENLAILEGYTKVPPELIREASRTWCEPNGDIHAEDLDTLQSFFGDRGLLEYDEPLDVEEIIDRSFAEAAVEMIGRSEQE